MNRVGGAVTGVVGFGTGKGENMKSVLRAVCCALGLLNAGLIQADEASRIYLELLHNSGMEAQYEQASALIVHNFRKEINARGQRSFTPQAVNEIGREIHKAFSPGVMKAVTVAYLRGHLSEQDARRARDWTNAPLGSKIAHLDKHAGTVEGQAAIEKFAASPDKNPMSKQQIQLIKGIADDTHAVDRVLDISLAIQKAVAAAALAASSRDNLASLPAVFAKIDERRDELKGYFAKTVLISFLYTYQSLTIDELQRYSQFVNSPSGSNFHKTMFEAMRQATTEAALRLGLALGKHR